MTIVSKEIVREDGETELKPFDYDIPERISTRSEHLMPVEPLSPEQRHSIRLRHINQRDLVWRKHKNEWVQKEIEVYDAFDSFGYRVSCFLDLETTWVLVVKTSPDYVSSDRRCGHQLFFIEAGVEEETPPVGTTIEGGYTIMTDKSEKQDAKTDDKPAKPKGPQIYGYPLTPLTVWLGTVVYDLEENARIRGDICVAFLEAGGINTAELKPNPRKFIADRIWHGQVEGRAMKPADVSKADAAKFTKQLAALQITCTEAREAATEAKATERAEKAKATREEKAAKAKKAAPKAEKPKAAAKKAAK